MWALVTRLHAQVRVAGMGGVIGLEYGTFLEMARVEGMDLKIMNYLFPYAEQGLVAAFARPEKGSGDDE